MARVAISCRTLWNETRAPAAWILVDLKTILTKSRLASFVRLFPRALQSARQIAAHFGELDNLASLAKHMCLSCPPHVSATSYIDCLGADSDSYYIDRANHKDLAPVLHLKKLELIQAPDNILTGVTLERLFPNLVDLRLDLRTRGTGCTAERLQDLLRRLSRLRIFSYRGPLSEISTDPHPKLQLPAQLESFVCCATNDDDNENAYNTRFRTITVSDSAPSQLRVLHLASLALSLRSKPMHTSVNEVFSFGSSSKEDNSSSREDDSSSREDDSSSREGISSRCKELHTLYYTANPWYPLSRTDLCNLLMLPALRHLALDDCARELPIDADTTEAAVEFSEPIVHGASVHSMRRLDVICYRLDGCRTRNRYVFANSAPAFVRGSLSLYTHLRELRVVPQSGLWHDNPFAIKSLLKALLDSETVRNKTLTYVQLYQTPKEAFLGPPSFESCPLKVTPPTHATFDRESKSDVEEKDVRDGYCDCVEDCTRCECVEAKRVCGEACHGYKLYTHIHARAHAFITFYDSILYEAHHTSNTNVVAANVYSASLSLSLSLSFHMSIKKTRSYLFDCNLIVCIPSVDPGISTRSIVIISRPKRYHCRE
jgi:hypothetical protein